METNLLRESFARIAPRKEEFAATFYQTLLTKYPQLHTLFADVDLKRQQVSLLATLQVIVNRAEGGEDLKAIFRKLGQRHNARQIRAEHYPPFGQTFLDTLALYDPQWNGELRAAWAAALEQCVRLMMESYPPDATIYRVQVGGVRKKM